LTLIKPNINNIGEELYAQSTFDPVTGMVAGSSAQQGTNGAGKPIFRYVYHPKWKDVLKTLYKKGKTGAILQTGTPYCLDTLGTKEVLKGIKGSAPDKTVRYKGSLDIGNRLLGELVALKVNIAASAKEKTATGFGGLVFNDPNDPTNPYNGQTINLIASKADSALSCAGGLKGSYTRGDLADLLERLNSEFSGSFDTVGFGSPFGAKTTGATRATGVKPLAMVDYLQATGPANEPTQEFNFTELYDNMTPKSFQLSQNYPNPFNPTTTIEFSLPADAFVTLKVYNMLGQEVATLVDREEWSEGDNTVDFDAASLSTGVYYYRLVVNDGEFQQVKKMMLMK
jgi:hypothetical protein